MKKKILAFFLAALMLFSTAGTLTASALTLPDLGEVAWAISQDSKNAAGSLLPLAKLSASLLGKMAPYLRDVVFTPDNMQTAENLGKTLMAKAMTKVQSAVETSYRDIKQSIEEILGKPTTEPTTQPSTENPTEPTTPPDQEPELPVTVGSLSDIMKKYIFIKVEDAPEVASKIAADSSIESHSFTDGNGTLYISVNIEENPEIFNYTVFRLVVENLYARQNEELLKNPQGDIDYVMFYEHIAGELAMHILLLALSSDVMTVTGSRNKTLVSLYESAALATLNIDEARVPTEAISIFGILLINFVRFNTYRILGLI